MSASTLPTSEETRTPSASTIRSEETTTVSTSAKTSINNPSLGDSSTQQSASTRKISHFIKGNYAMWTLQNLCQLMMKQSDYAEDHEINQEDIEHQNVLSRKFDKFISTKSKK